MTGDATKRSIRLKLTKEQQLALKRKAAQARAGDPQHEDGRYFTLRRKVQPIICGGGAVAVPWCGMVLAIEPDGYTHS